LQGKAADVNATERSALLQGLQFHDEMVVDERTLEILDRRRRTAVVRRRGWLVRRVLLAADIAGLIAAMLVVEWVTVRHAAPGTFNTRWDIIAFLVSLPGWVVVAKLYGLYEGDEERTNHSTVDDLAGVFHMVTVCTWTFAFFAYVTQVVHPTMPKLALFWVVAIALVCTARVVARTAARRNVTYLQNAVIVGAGDVGQLVARKLMRHPEYGINLVGFVDADPKERREDLEHLTLLGGTDRLPAIVRLFDVERVIIAFSNETHDATLDLIRSMKDLDVQIDIVPRLFELVGTGVGIHTVEGLPLVGLPSLRLSSSSRLLKRVMDLIAAALGLLALLPLLAVVAIATKLDSDGPVFFRQVRRGHDDATFRIWKFRTMVVDAEARKPQVAHLNRHLSPGGDPRMFKVIDDPRVTRVGRVLRRYSFDELPQLINVLVGEMSLVGPRPLILDEDDHVDSWGRRRLDLKPGITGPWQVHGRSCIPFDEMIALDYLYVVNWSPLEDLKLVLRTLPVVMRQAD
jgi:exopolysaccharide biosynthesis polyprenyl glycosylphosphotransferase